MPYKAFWVAASLTAIAGGESSQAAPPIILAITRSMYDLNVKIFFHSAVS